MRKKVKKRKISFQKIFSFISFIFILTCCLWYGGRFVYFYLDSKKANTTETASFAHTLKIENHNDKTFRKDKDVYYFYQDATDYYLMYSNILFRIVKINTDESITLISDESLTKLAYGVDGTNYQDSGIIKWLNQGVDSTYGGVLEKQIHNISNYLVKTSVCTDSVDDVEKITCDKINHDYYFGLLSVEDYLKTGGKKSFIHKDSPTYLANGYQKDKIWYIDEEGNLNQSFGDDLLSIRPVITLSPTLKIKSGNGTENEPYRLEEENSYFGGYVKLGNDLWRVFDEGNNQLKLMLTDYVKDTSGNHYQSIYSKQSYRHNDTINGSLAYYLNHTYYNSLSYKDSILNGNYYNGYYGEDTSYGLKELYVGEIDTHVAVPSIGDVIFDSNLSGFFTSTGIYKNSPSVYVIKSNEVTTKKVSSEALVVPCITIKKDILKKGTGTKSDPYSVE